MHRLETWVATPKAIYTFTQTSLLCELSVLIAKLDTK